jgi:hypothetical protein
LVDGPFMPMDMNRAMSIQFVLNAHAVDLRDREQFKALSIGPTVMRIRFSS